MAHTEDPPYLTVGTEVSAKYRGAFCEATIKTAKKLVKCKVSYGKGQSAVVTSDLIKGQLKVGGQVEVKQPDGQVLPASIVKLTDQSTYTVVFDDGDERTLKRSSLCLKGGRHFHESESLDHLPLTDPENFGTPVINSTKRKRRRGSQSPSSSSLTTASKRSCSYPTEFPVGKAVFLENDRRRSSWLPAVIVPAHYVLEASDRTPDTICLRSFKDGRYFAATKKELHEFSPTKEPLLSMLEGEIQAMYMCKPAIERAMAYIDTGELPWDMDLFDQNSQDVPASSHPLNSDPATSDEDNPQKGREEVDTAEAKTFEVQLQQFHESRGTPIQRPPTVGQHHLNLFQLYRLVKANGGMERVTMEMKWRSLYLQLGLPSNSSASHALRQAYRKYLYQYELHEKNKLKGGTREGWSRRHKAPPPPSSDEEDTQASHTTPTQQDQPNQQDRTRQQDKPAQQDKARRQDKMKTQEKSRQQERSREQRAGCGATVVKEEPTQPRLNGFDKEKEKGRKILLAEHKTIKMVKVDKLTKPFPTTSSGALKCQQPSADESETEEDRNCVSDTKSEGSDIESTPIAPGMADSSWREDLSTDLDCSTSLSACSLERGELGASGRDFEQCPEGYKENDRVLVLYGKGKTLRTYEAKVIGVERGEDKCDYLVHYSGWNNRYNEWIESTRIAGKLTEYTKRPHFHRVKKTPAPKSASSPTLFKPLNFPPGLLSPSLQAIINSGATQHRPVKKEKGHESISGKTISTKCSTPLVATSKHTPTKTSSSLLTTKPSSSSSSSAPSTPSTSTTTTSSSSCSNSNSNEPSGSKTPLRGSTRGVSNRGRGTRPERSRSRGNVQQQQQQQSVEQSSITTPSTSSDTNHIPTSPSLPGPAPCTSSSDETSTSGSSEEETPVIKQEKHSLWTTPPATPPTTTTATSSSHPTNTPTQVTSSASTTPSPVTTLVCSESLPGLLPKHLTTTTTSSITASSSHTPLPSSYASTLSLLAEPAAHSLLSLSTSTPTLPSPCPPSRPLTSTSPPSNSPPTPPAPSPQHSPSQPQPDTQQLMDQRHHKKEEDISKDKLEDMDSSPISSKVNSPDLNSGHVKSLDSVSGFGSGSGSGSEREGSPSPHETSMSSTKLLSGSPEGKRKWRPQDEESREEYEKRKKARHAEMNYTIDFSQLPPMDSVERISLIQERLREVQRHWTDLKAEVAYIERKRRRVKRKEREAHTRHANSAEVPSNATPPPPTSPHQPQLNNNSVISCH